MASGLWAGFKNTPSGVFLRASLLRHHGRAPFLWNEKLIDGRKGHERVNDIGQGHAEELTHSPAEDLESPVQSANNEQDPGDFMKHFYYSRVRLLCLDLFLDYTKPVYGKLGKKGRICRVQKTGFCQSCSPL